MKVPFSDDFWLQSSQDAAPLTPADLAAWTAKWHFELPAGLIQKLMRVNGGSLRFAAFPRRFDDPQEWAAMGVYSPPFRIHNIYALQEIMPVYDDGLTSVLDIGGEEDDAYRLCLDYRTSSIPSVARYVSPQSGAGLRGDDAVFRLAPTFDEFVEKLVRNTMYDAIALEAGDQGIDEVWREVCRSLDLKPDNSGRCGFHPHWESVPYDVYGPQPASFELDPNLQGGVIHYLSRSLKTLILTADTHPRHRSEILDSLQSGLSCQVVPLHLVDWWIWRSELSESLDEYRGHAG